MNNSILIFYLLFCGTTYANFNACDEKMDTEVNFRALVHRKLPPYSLKHTVPSTNKTLRNNVTIDPVKHRNWHLVNNDQCGISSEDRIVGGENATLGQYPWMVRIGYINEDDDRNIIFSCGGSLINKDFVLTAAHCTMNLPSSLHLHSVRLGEYNTNTDIDCDNNNCADPVVDLEIEKYFAHNEFGKPLKANDIALIKMVKSVKFTRWISSICLPYGSLLKKDLVENKVDIAGWGYYDITVPMGSIILQTIKLPVIKSAVCKRKFRKFKLNTERQLCVGGEKMKDSCNGDSGGPLMKVEVEGVESPRFYQFGIVSFGATYCGLTANPAVYTKITAYVNWILDQL